MSKGWRTVAVLVELPVKGNVSNKDVVDRVRFSIEAAPHPLADHIGRSNMGRWRVKDFARVASKKPARLFGGHE